MPNKPLTRADTPVALRVLLPSMAAFSWYIAWQWFIVSPEELAASVMLRTLDHLPSLKVWAAMFSVGAVGMTVALIRHRKSLYVYALAVVLAVLFLMALVSAVAAVNGVVSSSAWAWPALGVAVCVACLRGLTSRER